MRPGQAGDGNTDQTVDNNHDTTVSIQYLNIEFKLKSSLSQIDNRYSVCSQSFCQSHIPLDRVIVKLKTAFKF